MSAYDLPTRAEELVLSLGAIRHEKLGYPFLFLCTKGGPLHVKPDETAIFTRFYWPELANGKVSPGPNPYSGKWNWHRAFEPTGPEVLVRFEVALLRILPDEQARASSLYPVLNGWKVDEAQHRERLGYLASRLTGDPADSPDLWDLRQTLREPVAQALLAHETGGKPRLDLTRDECREVLAHWVLD
jgi:hypothetical protein